MGGVTLGPAGPPCWVGTMPPGGADSGDPPGGTGTITDGAGCASGPAGDAGGADPASGADGAAPGAPGGLIDGPTGIVNARGGGVVRNEVCPIRYPAARAMTKIPPSPIAMSPADSRTPLIPTAVPSCFMPQPSARFSSRLTPGCLLPPAPPPHAGRARALPPPPSHEDPAVPVVRDEEAGAEEHDQIIRQEAIDEDGATHDGGRDRAGREKGDQSGHRDLGHPHPAGNQERHAEHRRPEVGEGYEREPQADAHGPKDDGDAGHVQRRDRRRQEQEDPQRPLL